MQEPTTPADLLIDDDLLSEALQLGGHRTKQETVNEALRGYISRLRRLKVLEAFGTIDFDPDYDYKQARASR